MKIAIVDSTNKITNVVNAGKDFISSTRKFLAKESTLWIGDTYTDELALVENMQKEIDEEKVLKPTEIVITRIEGAIKTNSAFTWITAARGEDFHVEFQIDAGEERLFNLTLKGQGNTPEAKFLAQIDETGKGVVTLNFDAMGDYIFSNAEANKNLPTPLYSTKDILIEVCKK